MAKDLGFYQAAYKIGAFQSWDIWHENNGWSTDEKFIHGLGLVKVVHRKNDERDNGYYDDYRMGSTDELSVTFEVDFGNGGTVRYFRKYGQANSYGDPEWDGAFVEVKPAKQTIVVFEED